MNPNEIQNTDQVGPLLMEFIIDTDASPSREDKRITLTMAANGRLHHIKFPKFDINTGDVFGRHGFLFKFLPIDPGVLRLHIYGRPEHGKETLWYLIKQHLGIKF